ncbi:hypothetical protein HYFRA_00002738 [Hymenoscyphus fraxineus]|uniref:Lipoprotein n=1 Tax=Hymenoscyphus fraxineus TaxID=746836 RepID=A0A9N9KNS5_9HELO|nr:hypothetical protein HYFRA_00002738 [Hymenoscyphus fraxineus]
MQFSKIFVFAMAAMGVTACVDRDSQPNGTCQGTQNAFRLLTRWECSAADLTDKTSAVLTGSAMTMVETRELCDVRLGGGLARFEDTVRVQSVSRPDLGDL